MSLVAYTQYLDERFLSKSVSRKFIITGTSNYGKSMFALSMIVVLLILRGIQPKWKFIKQGLVYGREDFFRALTLCLDENFPFLYLDEMGQYFSGAKWKQNQDMVIKFQLDRIFGLLIPGTAVHRDQVCPEVRERTSFKDIRMLYMGGGVAIIRPFGTLIVPYLPSRLVNSFRSNEKYQKSLLMKTREK